MKKKEKKLLIVFSVFMMVLSLLTSCLKKGNASDELNAKKNAEKNVKGEIVVFAAQSMKASLGKVKQAFSSIYPNVNVVMTFDSSGNLVKMLNAGAECDLFVSADVATMDKIDIKAGGKDFIDSATRLNLLQNKLVLVVPENNPKDIKNFDDMIKKLKCGKILFAMGDKSVPAGNYMRKVFKYFGLDEDNVKANITYGTNVAVVAKQVKEGVADCGAVYRTDAFSNKLCVISLASDDMTQGPVIYPAAVLKKGKNTSLASIFLDFMKNDKNAKVAFESVGFTVL